MPFTQAGIPHYLQVSSSSHQHKQRHSGPDLTAPSKWKSALNWGEKGQRPSVHAEFSCLSERQFYAKLVIHSGSYISSPQYLLHNSSSIQSNFTALLFATHSCTKQLFAMSHSSGVAVKLCLTENAVSSPLSSRKYPQM